MKAEQDIKSFQAILNYKPHFTLKWGMTIIFLITAIFILLTTLIKYPRVVRVNSMAIIENFNDEYANYMLCKLADPNKRLKDVRTGEQIIINITDMEVPGLNICSSITSISHNADTLLLTLRTDNTSKIADLKKLKIRKEYHSISEFRLKENTIFELVIKNIPLFN